MISINPGYHAFIKSPTTCHFCRYNGSISQSLKKTLQNQNHVHLEADLGSYKLKGLLTWKEWRPLLSVVENPPKELYCCF